MWRFGGGRGPGGPRYDWGDVRGEPGTEMDRQAYRPAGLAWDPRDGSSEGLRRGEWQWRGHGPGALDDYAWEYRGGVQRHEGTVRRTEAGTGPDEEAYLAEERGGGLPRERGRFAADQWFERLGEGPRRGTGRPGYARYGRDVRYDRGYGGGERGYDRGYGGVGRSEGDRPSQSALWHRMPQRDIDAEMNAYGHGLPPAYNQWYGYAPGDQRRRQHRYGDDFRPRESF